MPRRIIDQRMCDRAQLLAREHPLGTVAALLGLHASQISRIRKRGWRAATHLALHRARPADLAIQQEHLSFAELCAHYRCGNTTLQRWLADLPGRRPCWRGRNRRRPA